MKRSINRPAMTNEKALIEKVAQLTRMVLSREKEISELKNLVIVMQSDLKFADAQDVCLKYHISRRTLLRYRRSGVIPSTRIGGTVCYSMQMIDDVLMRKMNVYQNG